MNKVIYHSSTINNLKYIVPQNMSLTQWLKYRDKNKISAKNYDKTHKTKWKVVHGHKKGHIGKALPGASNLTYEQASKMHQAIVISEHSRLLESISNSKAKLIASAFLHKIKSDIKKYKIVGSLQRNHAIVNDIDFVIITNNYNRFYNNLQKIDNNLIGKEKKIELNYSGIKIDIWLASNEYEFKYMCFHFEIGKKIISLKALAKKLGYKLTRYGLFDSNGDIVNIDPNQIVSFFKDKIKEK